MALLDRCNNLQGDLAPDVRERLQAVLDNPSQKTWDQAFSIVITDQGVELTLWQAWCAVDPEAPKLQPIKGPWPRIPDQFTLYRAVAQATKGDMKCTQARS